MFPLFDGGFDYGYSDGIFASTVISTGGDSGSAIAFNYWITASIVTITEPGTSSIVKPRDDRGVVGLPIHFAKIGQAAADADIYVWRAVDNDRLLS